MAIDDDAWDTQFVNAATPKSTGGTCVTPADCTTTNETPEKPVLSLVKDVQGNETTGGTAEPADWTVTADPVDIAGQGVLSGKGGASDEVLPGSYDLSEAFSADGNHPVGYTSTDEWSCVNDGGDGTAFSVDAAKDTVTLEPGAKVECTIVNTAQAPEWTLEKTSDKGAVVNPGDVITYTLTATHVSGVLPTGLDITDDLSDVLDNASWGGVVGTLPPGQSADFNEAGKSLVWHIDTLTGEANLSYQVTVNADAAGQDLVNAVSAPGSNCPPSEGSPLDRARADALAAVVGEGDGCSTTSSVPIWTLDKSSDPVTGDFVEPGQFIGYTLTVDNTSGVVDLAGATVVDDLSQVLDNAVLDETSYLVDGVAPAAGDVTFDATAKTLTWKVPTTAPGDQVLLTYQVQVNATFPVGTFFLNVAAPGSAEENPVNGTGSCVAEGECSTQQGTQVVEPPVVVPPKGGPKPPKKSTLPSTGGPNGWFVPFGAAMLLLGAGLVLASRRRRDAA